MGVRTPVTCTTNKKNLNKQRIEVLMQMTHSSDLSATDFNSINQSFRHFNQVSVRT
uniref:Ovule protein n=1 Tax=Haemonchus contortus TaxID=6289 RepID=A0A7I5EB74_HAECO